MTGRFTAAEQQTFDAPAESGPKRVGRYLIKEELAAGGMGVVYRAVDTTSGEECALKRIKAEIAANAYGIDAFEREYRVLAGINHPRIIRVYEYGKDETGAYYTMELVEGSDLRKLAPLDYREACRHLRDVAASLALLHARRLLHRDLSPRNVRASVDGRCKLLDFGALTEFGPSPKVVGTPPAVAPEALIGVALDQRTDLYALGALGYWLLTGRHAYPAKRLEELPSLWAGGLEPPSALIDGIPAALDELILGLLSRDALARPASAAEVISKLNVIAQLEPEEDEEESKLATSFLANPNFVGRKAELELLRQRIRRCDLRSRRRRADRRPAGTGRTRLLEELGLLGQLAGAARLARRRQHAQAAARHGARAGAAAARLRAARGRDHRAAHAGGDGTGRRGGVAHAPAPLDAGPCRRTPSLRWPHGVSLESLARRRQRSHAAA